MSDLSAYGYRAKTVSFEVPMADGAFDDPIEPVEREIRYELPPGEVFPKSIRRGKAVDMEFHVGPTTFTFRGWVKFRRLGVMVLTGRFE